MKNLPDKKNNTDALTCKCVEERIQDLLDLRQPLMEDALVKAHVAKCDDCEQLVADFGKLDASLSLFSMEIFDSVENAGAVCLNREDSIFSRSTPLAFVASVACLLLVMLTSGVWFSGDGDGLVSHQVNVSQEVFVTAPLAPPQLDETFFQTQWSSIADSTPSPNELLLSAVNFEKINSGVEPLHGYLDLTADLPGMKPVSDSVNMALHLLMSISDKPDPAKVVTPGNDPDIGYHADSLATLSYA